MRRLYLLGILSSPSTLRLIALPRSVPESLTGAFAICMLIVVLMHFNRQSFERKYSMEQMSLDGSRKTGDRIAD